MNKITMLGTGNATVTHIYNTCFTLQTSTTLLLVDAGGGNGILTQLRKADIQIADIHHLFVTHSHTDHVLGVIWVVRMVAQCKGYEGKLHVYGNDKVMRVIRTIIDMILAKKQLAKVEERVVFHELTVRASTWATSVSPASTSIPQRRSSTASVPNCLTEPSLPAWATSLTTRSTASTSDMLTG